PVVAHVNPCISIAQPQVQIDRVTHHGWRARLGPIQYQQAGLSPLIEYIAGSDVSDILIERDIVRAGEARGGKPFAAQGESGRITGVDDLESAIAAGGSEDGAINV